MNNKKSSSKVVMLILALGIFFITYNIVLFSICGVYNHGGVFWLSYAFMILAFIIIGIEGNIIKGKTTQPKDWLLGFPIIKHMTTYFVVELVASTIFMVLDIVYKCPLWVALVVQLVLFAIHMVLVLLGLITHDAIKDVQIQTKVSTSFIKLLQVEVEMMASRIQEPETKTEFTKLAEQIRYSDPVSSDKLITIENQIRTHITNADGFLAKNDFVRARQCCHHASLSLLERNKMCKLLK